MAIDKYSTPHTYTTKKASTRYQVDPNYLEGSKSTCNPWEIERKTCYRGVTSPLKQCKSSKNKGLYFWGCGKYPNKQCNNFEWRVDLEEESTQSIATRDEYMLKTLHKIVEKQQEQGNINLLLHLIIASSLFLIVFNILMYISFATWLS